MDSRRVAVVGEILQQLLLHRRIGQRLDLIKFFALLIDRLIELPVDQVHALFGKELAG